MNRLVKYLLFVLPLLFFTSTPYSQCGAVLPIGQPYQYGCCFDDPSDAPFLYISTCLEQGQISILSKSAQNCPVTATIYNECGNFILLVGGITGTTPGFSFGPCNVDLNLDPYSLATIISPQIYIPFIGLQNPPVSAPTGTVAAYCWDTEDIHVPSAIIGLNLCYAYFTLSPSTGNGLGVSNTSCLQVVP